MSRHIKKRDSAGPKISYEEWQACRVLLARARTAMSWREISIACGMNEGWAQAADKHRSVVNQHSLGKLEEVVKNLSEEALSVGVSASRIDVPAEAVQSARRRSVIPIGDARLRDRFNEIVDDLQARGLTPREVAEALGYSSWSGVHNARKRESVPEAWRVEKAERVLALLRQGKPQAAKAEAAKPKPLDRAPLDPTDAEYLRWVKEATEEARTAAAQDDSPPLARIGPPPAPMRTAPGRRVPEAPQAATEAPPAPAPRPVAPAPPKEPPAPAAPSVQDPYAALAGVKADLQRAAEQLEQIALAVPPFARGPWFEKRDGLITYIASLE